MVDVRTIDALLLGDAGDSPMACTADAACRPPTSRTEATVGARFGDADTGTNVESDAAYTVGRIERT